MGSDSPTGWRQVPLCDLVSTKVTYGVVKPGEEGPVSLVRATDLRDGRVLVAQLRTISTEVHDQYSRTHLKHRDLLIGLVGSPGEVALVPPELEGANLNRAVGLVRLACDEVLPEFAHAYFRSTGKALLLQQIVGSVQQVVNLSSLEKLPVAFPPLPQQRAICSVLGSLDNKITSNRRLAAQAEEVVLYAAEDVGGAQVPISSVATINANSIRAKDAPEEIGYIDISSVSPRRIENVQRMAFADAPSRARRLVAAGDTIISTVRPERRSLAFLDSPEPGAVASTGFAVLTPKEGVSPALLYALATTERATAHFSNVATGSAYPAVSPESIGAYEISMPDDGGARFEREYRPLLALGTGQLRESRTLTQIRDELLPKLVSGKIRVPLSEDPEEQIGAAVEELAATAEESA